MYDDGAEFMHLRYVMGDAARNESAHISIKNLQSQDVRTPVKMSLSDC